MRRRIRRYRFKTYDFESSVQPILIKDLISNHFRKVPKSSPLITEINHREILVLVIRCSVNRLLIPAH